MDSIPSVRRACRLSIGAAVLLCATPAAWSQICPQRLYNSPTAGIPVEIALPARGHVLVFATGRDEPIAQAPAQPGRGDLLELFPDLAVLAGGEVIIAQLECEGSLVGPPLVIEPLTPLPRASDAWTSRVVRALDSSDAPTIESLRRMPPRARESLRRAVDSEDVPTAGAHAWRVYEEKWAVLSTSAGSVTLAFRHDSAPRTAFHFRSLVEGGFYTGTTLRCIRDTTTGRPALIQAGDPSGDGGAGMTIPYERSPLRGTPGIVAAARAQGDPNSASSQFIVVLSDGLSGIIEESSTPFAVIVGGVGAVRAITREGAPPVTVFHATLVPAPPYAGPEQPISLVPANAADSPGR